MQLLAAALKVRSKMAASETGSPAWPGALSGGGSTVSVLVAVAIVVADMVGVGVFTSLGFQVKDIPSGFSILLLWTIGGVVALCGVFSYGELGAMFPRSSGEYNFLGRAYHPAFGFVAGWVSATVGFAAPVALAAMAFGEYGKSVLPNAPPLALAIGVVWLVSLVQLTGVRHSSTFQLVATILKVLLIIAFLVCGFVIGTPQPISFAPSTSDFTHIVSAPFAISLVFVMYSFSGWNAATYIIGEVRLPERNVPRAMLIGTLIVLVLYVALNAVFLHTAPDFRQPHLRGIRRPHRRCDDLLRIDLLDQRDDVDRAARHDDDGRGHAGAAGVRPKVDRRRAGLRHPVSAHGREPDAVYAQLRGGTRIHPVLFAVLFVLYGARGHQAADHASRPAAALPCLGLPGDPGGFPARDRLHDVLSVDGTAAALVP